MEALGQCVKSVQSYKDTRATQCRRSGVFIINFEQISRFFVVYSSLSLKKSMLAWLRLSTFCSTLFLSFIGLIKDFFGF